MSFVAAVCGAFSSVSSVVGHLLGGADSDGMTPRTELTFGRSAATAVYWSEGARVCTHPTLHTSESLVSPYLGLSRLSPPLLSSAHNSARAPCSWSARPACVGFECARIALCLASALSLRRSPCLPMA